VFGVVVFLGWRVCGCCGRVLAQPGSSAAMGEAAAGAMAVAWPSQGLRFGAEGSSSQHEQFKPSPWVKAGLRPRTVKVFENKSAVAFGVLGQQVVHGLRSRLCTCRGVAGFAAGGEV